MTITIQMIRDIINIDGTDELADAKVQSAIDRSEIFVTDIATRCAASAALITLTKMNYAAFLAFQTYSGRVVHNYQGTYDDNGIRTPIIPERERSAAAQLASLEKTYLENIAAMENSERQTQTARMPKVHHRRQLLPTKYEHTELDSTFWASHNDNNHEVETDDS